MTVEQLASRAPWSVQRAWENESLLPERLYRPTLAASDPLSLRAALDALSTSAISVPDGLLPITFVDDWSFACLVLDENNDFGWHVGQVIRWHLDDIDRRHQGALLDTDVELYLDSIVTEFDQELWKIGYRGITKVAQDYQRKFVDPQITPKSHDLRPFQLACQNVIIGLAAFKRQVSIDGEAVPYWLTCEAPHVATYEGPRALSALLLCDAFQSGGTMEISFAAHPEHSVPASLRRYARTLGINLGVEISGGKSISPREARALFVAVTPMPQDLRKRFHLLLEDGVVSAERLCYALLAAVWSAASLDFLAACSSGKRLQSILTGGADVFDRPNRAAEMELTRAAVLFDIFIKRVDAKDVAASVDGQAVRLFEDTKNGVDWHVHDDLGAVEVMNIPAGHLPWHPSATSEGRIIVLPRAHPVRDDFELAQRLAAGSLMGGAPAAVLTSAGSRAEDLGEIAVLKCPVRLAEIDLQIERSLQSLTLGRA